MDVWLEDLGFVRVVHAIGLVYLAYFVTALAALACLAAAPDAQWPVVVGVVQVCVAAGLHFGATALGFYIHGEAYELAPVPPAALFFFADVAVAGVVGAAIAAHALDRTHRVAVLVALATTIGAQLLCFHKTRRLVADVRAGVRSARTGRRV